jgi:hypothetical protein
MLIAVVGYFLRGILSTIKRIEADFSKFREEYAGHRVIMQEHRERLDKIEGKFDQLERDWKFFYVEYASKNKDN